MKKRATLPLQFAVALGLIVSGDVPLALAQDAGSTPAKPDNSKMNKGDATKSAMTADQQKNNKADRDTTAQIRKALMNDKTLSTYAHNVKIITRAGMVTLKGPVRSDDEKATVEKAAKDVAGEGKVTNELTVAPGKNKS